MSGPTDAPRKKRDPQTAIARNILITLPVCFLLVFLIDGFLLHPIPAPAGAFDLDNPSPPDFELTGSSAPYADAEIIDSIISDPEVKIYLVNADGQLHLLDFQEHFITRRMALKRDISITSEETQQYKLGWAFNQMYVEISQGHITLRDTKGGSTYPHQMLTIYFLITVPLTAMESFFYRKIARVKWA